MLFPPPYTYNDPRILYNEPCFFYDGIFDSVCLANKFTSARGHGGGLTSGKQQQPKEKLKEHLNVFIECELIRINDLLIQCEKPTWLRFVGENDDVDIFAGDFKISLSNPIIKGEYINIIKKLFVSTSFKGIKTEDSCITPNDIEMKVQYIEPYEKIKVQATLINVKTKKDNE